MLTQENTPALPNFHIQPHPQNTLRDTRRECRLMCETNTLADKKSTCVDENMVRIHFYTQSETFSPTQLYANTHTHTHTHIVFSTFTTIRLREKKCQINKWLQQKRKSQDVTAMSGEKACKPYLFRFFPNLKKMGWCDETNSLKSLHQTQTLQSSHWTGFSVWIALAERMANRRLEGTRSHQLLGVKPSESLMRWSLHWTCLDLSHQST